MPWVAEQGSAKGSIIVSVVVSALVAISAAHAGQFCGGPGQPPCDALQIYANQCDAAIGVTVPNFDCDDPLATEVPNQGSSSGQSAKCDFPNRLNEECDPGSRFRVLHQSADAYIVAHCRKKLRGNNGPGQYGDIAVIQYGRKDGATCFYQAGPNPFMSHAVNAPARGLGKWERDPATASDTSVWQPPQTVAGEGCGGCHDNGPFVRSPYLAQVTGANALPGSPNFLGTDAFRFNKTQLYAFVGQEFASWKAFKVEIENNRCNDCHRMGVNNVAAGNGTALDFGLRATADCTPISPPTCDLQKDSDCCEVSKNPHSPPSPIWMTPGQITFSANNRAAAQAIHDCAMRLQELPNTPTCKISKFAEAWVRPPPMCPTGVRADTNLNRSETTFSWSTPPMIDHLFIRRNGHAGPSGLLVFSNGKSVLPPSVTTVTVPFDLATADYLATYNVCTVADDAQSCCTAPITPTRSLCVEVAKCRVHGREVLATDTDDPQTWCADVGGKIDHFMECSATGDGTTTTTTTRIP